ncbi:unnamed protein product [Closterium sp. NIES-65]|nr:unnamed protein product [Closterium sp. NIES-65]
MAVRSAAAVRLARLPLSQREIVGPLLRPPPSFLRPSASTAPSQSVSLQTSQQLSSGVAAPPHRLSPVPLAPLDPLPSPPCSSPPPPPLAHPPLPSSAGAPLVPPPPSPPGPRASLPPVEPPQGQHPLVPSGPAPEARFPPRSRSPELPPDAPDPEDDGCWWNGVVREAAAQGLWRLLHFPLESKFPDQNKGPGARAFRQVAKAAEESPLQLVPLLAVLLRWICRRFYMLNRV